MKLIRRNIGHGVELIYEMGKVSLKNMSEGSVFVQSAQMNNTWNLDSKGDYFFESKLSLVRSFIF